jgi:lipopolysaccharide heptosyltransferase II
MNRWNNLSNILIIRLDNMGDVLMSVPAINALKETFKCKISLLTSSASTPIIPLISSIDEVIIYEAPWMKDREEFSAKEMFRLISLLKLKNFDAAILFSAFSQNPLPAMMVAYWANIPLRLAYCRENPYQLITDWLPDKEPYQLLRHQVRRDLDLLKHVGVPTYQESITLSLPTWAWNPAQEKLKAAGVDVSQPYVIFHPGVSEVKRQYPATGWAEVARKLGHCSNRQIIFTGIEKERPLIEEIKAKSGGVVFQLAGALTIEEFVMTINHADLVVSVNTSTAHIAAATQTKIIVLYAMTNPQHTPWKVPGMILPFEVPQSLQSKNEVLRYVVQKYFPPDPEILTPQRVVDAAITVLREDFMELIPETFDFKLNLTAFPNAMYTA